MTRLSWISGVYLGGFISGVFLASGMPFGFLWLSKTGYPWEIASAGILFGMTLLLVSVYKLAGVTTVLNTHGVPFKLVKDVICEDCLSTMLPRPALLGIEFECPRCHNVVQPATDTGGNLV